MRVALVQMNIEAGNIDRNRRHGISLAEKASQQADVVVMPEVWTTGYALKGIEATAEDYHGSTITMLKKVASKNSAAIVAGSLALKIDQKIYNSAVVIDSTGNIIDDYQKIHLFSMFGEQRFFSPGNKRTEFYCCGIKSGLAICYDLRFPELFRVMAANGVKIVYVPAEWPLVRGDNWRLLVQARAVENQMYVCAVNCSGEYKGAPFYGHSMLVAPTGDIIAEGGREEEILYGDVDEKLVDIVREGMSVLQDRRPELYYG